MVKSTDSLLSDVAHSGSFWDEDARLYQKRARWYDPGTGRFIGEDPATDGNNWYAYAGNDPINFTDPTGLSQQGHPLDSLAGGFGSNEIATVKQAFTTVGQTFGKIGSLAAAPFTALDSLAGNTFSAVARNSFPVANSVVKAGIGVGATAASTVTPFFINNADLLNASTSQLKKTRDNNLQRREQEYAASQHREAMFQATLRGDHGRVRQRSAMKELDRRFLEGGPPSIPEMFIQTQQRLSSEVLLATTGLTTEEAALGTLKATISAGHNVGLLERDVYRSDEFFVQQPGFQVFEGGVETVFNPLTYAGVGIGTTRMAPVLAPVRILEDVPNARHNLRPLVSFDGPSRNLYSQIDIVPDDRIITQIDVLPQQPRFRSIYNDGTLVIDGTQPPRLSPRRDPSATGVHSTVRFDTVNQRVYQLREFDSSGSPVRDIDFTNPTFPNGRPRPAHAGPPHQHRFLINDPHVGPRSGFKRGGQEPIN